ncbi:MAG: hypothetical protein LBG48_02445, partial [Rickettsiales bacterium]|nr:hypothetical protein [Rickettsiales bacterium]
MADLLRGRATRRGAIRRGRRGGTRGRAERVTRAGMASSTSSVVVYELQNRLAFRLNLFYRDAGEKGRNAYGFVIEEPGSTLGVTPLTEELIKFNLAKKTITGLLGDELLCFAIAKISDENRKKVVALDEIQDLDTVENSGGTDFILTPIIKKNPDGLLRHWVTAVVHFKEDESRDICLFDSQQTDETPFIGKEDGLQNDCILLNHEDWQKSSKACGYFSFNFIARAAMCKDFNELCTCIENGL